MTTGERVRSFSELMGSNVTEEFKVWLLKKGFFEAPASIHHHGTYRGGLYDHSVAVTKALLNLTDRLELTWCLGRSPYVVGMFHDLCKIDYFQHEERPGDEEWEYNNAILLPGHGEKSVILLQQHLHLTDEEMMCIRWHHGAFDNKTNWNSYGRSVTVWPNVLYTHTADMIAARIMGV